MSKGNTLIKIVVIGATLFGAYKLYKAIDEQEKKKAEELKKHREQVLEEIEGELHQAEEWNKEIKDLTLNNENLKPSDRAYAYDISKSRYDAIVKAKSIEAIDEAREDFEELIDILMNVKDPDTLETYFKIDADKKADAERLRQEKAARDLEMEKYNKISDVIERIGTKVVCDLVR